MKQKRKLLLIIISLLALSCKESINGPNDNSSPSSNSKRLFVGQMFSIPVSLIRPLGENEYLDFDQWFYEYFTVGYSFTNDKRNEINLLIHASKVSPGPISKIITFANGNQKYYQPVNINVIDFYYASSFEKNVGDTLYLKSGTNFLLQFTCKDSANKLTTKNAISQLIGYGYGFNSEKIYANAIYGDTTNFSFLISALPNLTPSPLDTGIIFRVQLSNKVFKLPIKIAY